MYLLLFLLCSLAGVFHSRFRAFNSRLVRHRRCRPQGMKPLAPAVPAKARTHLSAAPTAERWTPAFAGEAFNIIRRHEPRCFFLGRREFSGRLITETVRQLLDLTYGFPGEAAKKYRGIEKIPG